MSQQHIASRPFLSSFQFSYIDLYVPFSPALQTKLLFFTFLFSSFFSMDCDLLQISLLQ